MHKFFGVVKHLLILDLNEHLVRSRFRNFIVLFMKEMELVLSRDQGRSPMILTDRTGQTPGKKIGKKCGQLHQRLLAGFSDVSIFHQSNS